MSWLRWHKSNHTVVVRETRRTCYSLAIDRKATEFQCKVSGSLQLRTFESIRTTQSFLLPLQPLQLLFFTLCTHLLVPKLHCFPHLNFECHRGRWPSKYIMHYITWNMNRCDSEYTVLLFKRFSLLCVLHTWGLLGCLFVFLQVFTLRSPNRRTLTSKASIKYLWSWSGQCNSS